MSPNWSDGEGSCWCPTGRTNGLSHPHREGEPGCLSAPAGVRAPATVLAELNNALTPIFLALDAWKDQEGVNANALDDAAEATPRARALLVELGARLAGR